MMRAEQALRHRPQLPLAARIRGFWADMPDESARNSPADGQPARLLHLRRPIKKEQ